MSGLVDATRNAMLDALTGLLQYASLHTGDPGTSGTAEVNGGAPAYARKPLSWASASSSSKSTSAQMVFDVPGGGTMITHVGYWSAATGGTFYGSRPLDTPQTYPTQGTYTMAAGQVTENLT